MRNIPVTKKMSVLDISVGDIFSTNLIAYNLVLTVDDSGKQKTEVVFSLEENARKVGFQDDFNDFLTYKNDLHYIKLDCGKSAKFLSDHYVRFRLDKSLLKIKITAEDFQEYYTKVSVLGKDVLFQVKQ